jgi:hypothetical protein
MSHRIPRSIQSGAVSAAFLLALGAPAMGQSAQGRAKSAADW